MTLRTRHPLTLLAALLAIVALAMVVEAQTPPPATGDWVVEDVTVFSDTSITIDGDVFVQNGGHLTLVNVDLTLTRTFGINSVRAQMNGTLTMEGCTVAYIASYPPYFYLENQSTINGTAFDGVYSIALYDWGGSVTNCTFQKVEGFISGVPGKNLLATRPLVIADNTILASYHGAIRVELRPRPGDHPVVEVVGNDIVTSANGHGIEVSTFLLDTYDNLTLVVEDNKVTNVGNDGIHLDLRVNHTVLRFDGNDVEDADGDCVHILLDFETLDFPGIDDLRSMTADGTCLRIGARSGVLDGLALSNLTLGGGGQASLTLTNVWNATLVDSRIESGSPANDVIVTNSTLDIYRTRQRKGNAKAYHETSRITSWRTVELVCQWSNGRPIPNARVDLLCPDREVVLTNTTDPDGYWGNMTTWDWWLNSSASEVRLNLEAVLVGPGWNLSYRSIPFDGDIEGTIRFNDTVVPVLAITAPAVGHLQNSTDLLVTGTASDDQSGLALVQVSLDPGPDWSSKVWTDASGTESWQVTLPDVPDGVHTVFVRAFDKANAPDGLFGNATVAGVEVDTTPPVIDVSQPRTGTVLTNLPSILVEGNVSEDVDLFKAMGAPAPLEGTSFSLLIGLEAGTNAIVLEARDRAGNVGGFDALQVVFDPAPPVITITSPASGALLDTTDVVVQGRVDKDVRDGQVVINGETAALHEGTFEHLLSGLKDGPFAINVSTVDLAGNTGTARVDVTVDTIPPALEILSPADGFLTNHAGLRVEGVSEAGVTVTVSGVPADMEDDAFSADVTLEEGLSTVHVVATDAAGNMNSSVLSVRLDTVPPDLVIDSVVNGTITTREDAYDLTGATEAGASLRLSLVGIDLNGVVKSDGSFVETLVLDRKETTVIVTVTDEAGNSVRQEVLIRRVEPPVPPEPSGPGPVVVAAVTATTVLVIGAAVVSIEFTKYSLFVLLLPLYARLKRQEVLDNKTRLAIHGLVVENPGMHYNEIIREFGLTNGVAAYHLDVLEREGFVRSVRDGSLRRFYSTTTKVPTEFRMTPEQVRERIVDLVEAHPGINQKTLVDELGLGRTLVGYHLKALKDEGYVKASRQGRFTVYRRTKKRWFRNS